jgi:hypothetical protein
MSLTHKEKLKRKYGYETSYNIIGYVVGNSAD